MLANETTEVILLCRCTHQALSPSHQENFVEFGFGVVLLAATLGTSFHSSHYLSIGNSTAYLTSPQQLGSFSPLVFPQNCNATSQGKSCCSIGNATCWMLEFAGLHATPKRHPWNTPSISQCKPKVN
eukprot:646259-Amphidinium_carterae.1